MKVTHLSSSEVWITLRTSSVKQIDMLIELLETVLFGRYSIFSIADS